MAEQLLPQYNPKDVEPRWFEFWASTPLFHARADSGKKPFSIVIPPPNVTGILHMGHALNNTIQDILIRARRMQGYEALWMPGTDHAGIATQNVVERKIAKEGLTRRDLGREKFLERVWDWKNAYGSTIIHQLKRMGATCDWSRERFTMDEGYSEAVKDVFVSLYEKGLIYQGDYIINWCPRCQTALADEEAPHHDLDGKLYYIKYPIREGEGPKVKRPKSSKAQKSKTRSKDDSVIVATTRPETMLGDTAVAVHPLDKRYKHLIGATLMLPLMEREIPVIADKLIDRKFGTGCVKVTPAHDPNDYAMGKTHHLPFINIMRPDGVLNEHAGEYAGMDRFEAREAILEDLRERKLLVKIEDHKHAVGHCYRCHTIVEPYLSKQWFVKMKPLAEPAIKAVKKGAIKFHPARWTKVYLNWMVNIRDWCISRQIWWGHRLPVWYCDSCLKIVQGDPVTRRPEKNKEQRTKNQESQKGVIVSRTVPDKCPGCGSTNLRQDEDVLDTWFSSWLWPFATFGWPSSNSVSETDKFYPTSVLVTAPEIIFFWVARMIMAGFEFMDKKPFADVYIHGTVRDEEGKKMSKSLGNSIDPLAIIDQYGADALRFSLIAQAASGSDLYLSPERFEQGRNFANKIWNASRFILMNLKEGVTGDGIVHGQLRESDKSILSELNRTIEKVAKSIDDFKFNKAVNIGYEFFWHEFCDWYVEIAKQTIGEKNTQEVLVHVLKQSLLLLHPFMPFITDEIAAKLPGKNTQTLSCGAWPVPQKEFDNKGKWLSLVKKLVFDIRNIKKDLSLNPQDPISGYTYSSGMPKEYIGSVTETASKLASAELSLATGKLDDSNSVAFSIDRDFFFYLDSDKLGGVEQIKKNIDKKSEDTQRQIKQKEGMLKNKEFVKKAPEAVVTRERLRLTELKEDSERLQKVRRAIR